MREPIVGELVSIERTVSYNPIKTRTAFGVVVPARYRWPDCGQWCIYWFDLAIYGADFRDDSPDWVGFKKYLEE